MLTIHREDSLRSATVLLLSLFVSSPPLLAAGSNAFKQTNLTSDIPGLAANTDPDLVNPWGMAASGTSPFWVSDNGTGKTTLYNGLGVKQGLVVSMPAGSEKLTGQVFSGGSGGFNGDVFLFATENGTVTGWRGALGTTAEVLHTSTDGAVYTGLALGRSAGNPYAYAADFHNGKIDVVKGTAVAPTLAGSFTAPTLPSDYAPFNIQNLGNKLYVSYALRDGANEAVAGAGNGFVDQFDLEGNFLQRLVNGGPLNAPWGMAIAPLGWGPFGGALLVGNFGDGLINAFNATTGAFIDSIRDANGTPIAIEGLWGLAFGNAAVGSSPNSLYFTAGISDGVGGEVEAHGLYGKLTHVPDAGTSALLLAAGLCSVYAARRFLKPNGHSACLT